MSLLTDKARKQLLENNTVDAFLIAELIGIAVRVEKLANEWQQDVHRRTMNDLARQMTGKLCEAIEGKKE